MGGRSRDSRPGEALAGSAAERRLEGEADDAAGLATHRHTAAQAASVPQTRRSVDDTIIDYSQPPVVVEEVREVRIPEEANSGLWDRDTAELEVESYTSDPNAEEGSLHEFEVEIEEPTIGRSDPEVEQALADVVGVGLLEQPSTEIREEVEHALRDGSSFSYAEQVAAAADQLEPDIEIVIDVGTGMEDLVESVDQDEPAQLEASVATFVPEADGDLEPDSSAGEKAPSIISTPRPAEEAVGEDLSPPLDDLEEDTSEEHRNPSREALLGDFGAVGEYTANADVDASKEVDFPTNAPTEPPFGFVSSQEVPQVDLEEPPKAPRSRRTGAWWEAFFDDGYLRTQPELTAEQLSRQCDFIQSSLDLAPGARILDLGCGVGRQALELSRRGYDVTALDVSESMLSRATDLALAGTQDLHLVQGDMRDLDFVEEFDAVICVGTTFGYFDDDMNLEVVRRVHRALKHRGVLLIDVCNRDHAVRQQPNMAWYEGQACVCMEETAFNYISSRLQVKRTMMFEGGVQREAEYTLRLYSLHELGKLLHSCGFRVTQVSGREATPGVFFGADSPRMLVVGERRTRSVPSEMPQEDPLLSYESV